MKKLIILFILALSTTLATVSAQADFFGGGGYPTMPYGGGYGYPMPQMPAPVVPSP